MRSQSEKIALAECIKLFTGSYDVFSSAYSLNEEEVAALLNVNVDDFKEEYNKRVNDAAIYSSQLDFNYIKDSYFFTNGNLSILEKQKILILGARRHSAQGKQEVLLQIKAIAANNAALVISLEPGISLFALSCAVKFNVPVIIVLANPFNMIKKEISSEILAALPKDNILFLSPFYMFEKVVAWNKIIRNRKLENISDKLIIAEELDGGPSWTSCDNFIQEGKDVCVPNSLFSNPNSSFSKKLVDNGVIYTYKNEKEAFSFIKGSRRTKVTKSSK